MVEILLAISVIAILAGIGGGLYSGAVHQAALMRETTAAKVLLTAYTAAAADNNGRYLPGYDRTAGRIVLPDNTAIEGPAAERYPYRLAPYFNYRMKGVILVNENAKEIDASSSYLISCYPAFAINNLFVGGDVAADGTLTFPDECLTRQAQGGGSLLAFATAAGGGRDGSEAASTNIHGYCILTPPNERTAMWSSAAWSRNAEPADYGHLDARHSGKALCAFLDGSVRLLSVGELRDMRLWSRNAAAQNAPNYLIPPAPRPGGRL